MTDAEPDAPRWPTVLFDLDGTLVNTIPLIVASYQHAYRTVLGEERDDITARSWIGRPLLDTFREDRPEHADALDTAYRTWNLANTERLIERFAGVPELVADLAAAGREIGVVTSKRRETALVALRLVGLEGAVDVVGAMEDTAAHKPDPEPLTTALTRLGADAREAVYVGDATVDVLAARAAGLAAVAVTWGAGTRESLVAAGPDHLVESVEELRALLLG